MAQDKTGPQTPDGSEANDADEQPTLFAGMRGQDPHGAPSGFVPSAEQRSAKFGHMVERLRDLVSQPMLTSEQLYELSYWSRRVAVELGIEARRQGLADIALPIARQS